jgi:hypothetical protein
MIRYTEGHYEIKDVEPDRVYTWCRPESIIVECECGHEPALTCSETICEGCGADYAAIVTDYANLAREELNIWQMEEAIRPWR